MPNPENVKPFEFKKGKSGNPGGRPRKFISTLKDEGYTMSQISDTMKVLMVCDESEITAAKDDQTLTIIERTVAAVLLKCMKDGDMKPVETILSRVFGQPKQEMQLDIDLQQPLFPDVLVNQKKDSQN